MVAVAVDDAAGIAVADGVDDAVAGADCVGAAADGSDGGGPGATLMMLKGQTKKSN